MRDVYYRAVLKRKPSPYWAPSALPSEFDESSAGSERALEFKVEASFTAGADNMHVVTEEGQVNVLDFSKARANVNAVLDVGRRYGKGVRALNCQPGSGDGQCGNDEGNTQVASELGHGPNA